MLLAVAGLLIDDSDGIDPKECCIVKFCTLAGRCRTIQYDSLVRGLFQLVWDCLKLCLTQSSRWS